MNNAIHVWLNTEAGDLLSEYKPEGIIVKRDILLDLVNQPYYSSLDSSMGTIKAYEREKSGDDNYIGSFGLQNGNIMPDMGLRPAYLSTISYLLDLSLVLQNYLEREGILDRDGSNIYVYLDSNKLAYKFIDNPNDLDLAYKED